MHKSLLLISLIFTLSSCYTGYYSKFHEEGNKSTNFELVPDSTTRLYFHIYGFDWRSRYSKQDYTFRKLNSSLRFYFNIENNNSVRIKNFDFKIRGISESDTVNLNPKYIEIDLSGTTQNSDYQLNNKLKIKDKQYKLNETFLLDSAFNDFYFPAHREIYHYTLFKIIIHDSKASDCDKFILNLVMDAEINNKPHQINRRFDIIKTIEKRTEIGIH